MFVSLEQLYRETDNVKPIPKTVQKETHILNIVNENRTISVRKMAKTNKYLYFKYKDS